MQDKAYILAEADDFAAVRFDPTVFWGLSMSGKCGDGDQLVRPFRV